MWKYSDILFSRSDLLTKYLKNKFPYKKIKTLYNPVRKKGDIKHYIKSQK